MVFWNSSSALSMPSILSSSTSFELSCSESVVEDPPGVSGLWVGEVWLV
jgi:hypothetical protein